MTLNIIKRGWKSVLDLMLNVVQNDGKRKKKIEMHRIYFNYVERECGTRSMVESQSPIKL